jgi:phospholipid/cholesterol/gamma-HCH transport system substrate-binding protein
MNRMSRMGERFREIAKVSPLGTSMVILAALGAVAVIVLMLKQVGVQLPFISQGRFSVVADFSNADGLTQGEKPPVNVAGVQLGRVSDVRYVNGYAQATFSLENSARGKLFRNAAVLITPRSALNDLTVDIDPGTPSAGALQPGGVIPQSLTQTAVNFDELTSVLNLDTRSQLAVLVDQLGIGLNGRSRSLDEALRELKPFLSDTSGLAAQLAVHRRMLSRLISDLDVVFTALGERGEQLRNIISSGERTMGTVAAHQAGVEQTMSELGPTLDSLNRSLSAVTALSQPLAPALDSLRPLAAALPGGLSSLRAFVPDGEGLVKDLLTLDRDGPRGVNSLQGLLGELAPATASLQPTANDLLPVMQALDRHPAGIGRLGSNFSGVFSDQNANGPTLRAFGFFEPPRPENFGFPVGTSTASVSSLETDLAQALDHVCLTTNPLACVARYLTPSLPKPVVTGRGLR